MRRLILFVLGLTAALVLVPTTAVADSATHRYMLVMEEPNFGLAPNGDQIARGMHARQHAHVPPVEREAAHQCSRPQVQALLYLREVLGFSYKEIGAVMGLTMPATETLVFRARAALRREYERSGGSAAGYGLIGLRLARLGLGRRRDVAVSDRLATAAANEGGLGSFSGRLAQFFSTSLPGCSAAPPA